MLPLLGACQDPGKGIFLGSQPVSWAGLALSLHPSPGMAAQSSGRRIHSHSCSPSCARAMGVLGIRSGVSLFMGTGRFPPQLHPQVRKSLLLLCQRCFRSRLDRLHHSCLHCCLQLPSQARNAEDFSVPQVLRPTPGWRIQHRTRSELTPSLRPCAPAPGGASVQNHQHFSPSLIPLFSFSWEKVMETFSLQATLKLRCVPGRARW